MICSSSHPQIRQRAQDIFQERMQTGRKGDALSDWLEAEHEIRRHRIPARASMLHLHPKPTTLPLNLRGFSRFQAFSGSPLPITGSSCQTNQALSTCNVNLNPNFSPSGSARVNGNWGHGITAANTGAISYIATSAGSEAAPTGPFILPSLLAVNTTTFPNGSPFAPSFTFPNGARVAGARVSVLLQLAGAPEPGPAASC